MATTVNDVLSAIDQYMASNGRGQSYLASKFIDLFENKDSVFNMQTGPLKALGDKVQDVTKKIISVEKSMTSLDKKIKTYRDAMKYGHFGLLEKASESLRKKILAYSKNLNIPNLNNPQTNTGGKSVYDILKKIEVNTYSTRIQLIPIRYALEDMRRERILGNGSSTGNFQGNNRTTNVYNVTNLPRSNNPRESGAILPSLMKFLALGSAAFLGAGVIGKYLDKSGIGQVIKKSVSSFFNYIGTGITNFMKSGKLSEMVSDSLKAIGDLGGYIFDGIVGFIRANKESIIKTIGDVGISFKDNVIIPLFKRIQDSFNRGDYIDTAVTSLGTYGIYKMLTSLPVIKQLKDIVFKTIGGAFSLITSGAKNASKLMPFLKQLMPMLTKVGKFLGPMGYVVGTVAAIQSITDSLNKMNESVKIMDSNIRAVNDSSSNVTKNAQAFIQEFGDKNIQIIDNLEKKLMTGNITKSEEYQLQSLKIERENLELNKRLADINEQENKTNNTKWNAFMSKIGLERTTPGYIKGELTEINKTIDRNIEVLNNLDKSKKGTSDGRTHNARMQEEVSNIIKNIKATKVQDAEIVIPDKKDAHIFAKGGGPFDKALKDLTHKVDVLTEIMANGMKGLASVTAQSGGQVVQAIVSTAGASQSIPLSTGGSDPIRDFRDRAARHINNGK